MKEIIFEPKDFEKIDELIKKHGDFKGILFLNDYLLGQSSEEIVNCIFNNLYNGTFTKYNYSSLKILESNIKALRGTIFFDNMYSEYFIAAMLVHNLKKGKFTKFNKELIPNILERIYLPSEYKLERGFLLAKRYIEENENEEVLNNFKYLLEGYPRMYKNLYNKEYTKTNIIKSLTNYNYIKSYFKEYSMIFILRRFNSLLDQVLYQDKNEIVSIINFLEINLHDYDIKNEENYELFIKIIAYRMYYTSIECASDTTLFLNLKKLNTFMLNEKTKELVLDVLNEFLNIISENDEIIEELIPVILQAKPYPESTLYHFQKLIKFSRNKKIMSIMINNL